MRTDLPNPSLQLLRCITTWLGTILLLQSTVKWRFDHHQMALRSVANKKSFGTPGQTKVSGDQQRETTHEVCCLAAEFKKYR